MYNVYDIDKKFSELEDKLFDLKQTALEFASMIAQSNVRLSREAIGDQNVGIAFDNAVIALISETTDFEDVYNKCRYRFLQLSDLYGPNKIPTGFRVDDNDDEEDDNEDEEDDK